MAIYRITDDGQVFTRSKLKIPLVGKGMEFTGEFKEILKEEKPLKITVNNRGYASVAMLKTTLMVHNLVAQEFCSNPDDKPEVNHIDGNKLNNHYSNLEWVTRAENLKHARDTGLNRNIRVKKHTYSSEETRTKCLANLVDKSALTDDQVRYCREVHIPRHKEFSSTALAEQFGVSVAAMSKIVKGQTYSHVK